MVAFSVRKATATFVLAAALAAGAQAEEADSKTDFDFEHVSCNGGKRETRLVVKDVKKSIGRITADVYPNDPESFLRGRRGGRIMQVKFAAKSPVTHFCITVPESGQFAVAVYHDKNANNNFDRGPFGLPAEPWGISNNPKVRFRPPSVEEAIFPVGIDGAKVEIRLN